MVLGEYKRTRLGTFIGWMQMVIHFARTSYQQYLRICHGFSSACEVKKDSGDSSVSIEEAWKKMLDSYAISCIEDMKETQRLIHEGATAYAFFKTQETKHD
jgi:hypothetical protein